MRMVVFDQTGPTGKSGPLQRVDQYFRNFSGGPNFGPKFPECSVEWIATMWLHLFPDSSPLFCTSLKLMASRVLIIKRYQAGSKFLIGTGTAKGQLNVFRTSSVSRTGTAF